MEAVVTHYKDIRDWQTLMKRPVNLEQAGTEREGQERKEEFEIIPKVTHIWLHVHCKPAEALIHVGPPIRCHWRRKTTYQASFK